MPHPNDLGHGRPARMVFRKTGGTPVPPGLCRPSYSQHTPANARVQGLGAIFTAFRLDRPCRMPEKVRGRPGGPTLPRGRRTMSKCDGPLV